MRVLQFNNLLFFLFTLNCLLFYFNTSLVVWKVILNKLLLIVLDFKLELFYCDFWFVLNIFLFKLRYPHLAHSTMTICALAFLRYENKTKF